MTETFGPYRVIRRLGEGGMGVVYEAEDSRLGRVVALKTVREGADARGRERLLREARSAAAVSHPAICQVFDVGESDGAVFIAMELLAGEPLSARVARGPLPVREAAGVALDVLGALGALHRQGLVHRDLKPSNVFLTPHGLKLLDFGLAKSLAPEMTSGDATLPGTLLGTPSYMAPEQLSGAACDARTDLWAAGVLLYELLTGRPLFTGTLPQVIHAVAHAPIPALGGSHAVAVVEGVLRRALARQPQDRYASADAMARALREAIASAESGEVARASRLTRLIALPLRLLRPDPEIEFLAFSLADAITTSLSSLGSLVVRSSLTAARLVTDPLDLRAVADQAEVDVIVAGTLLRAGAQVRIGVQLLEAPSGTVLWSQTRQVPLDQLFELQDEVAQRVADSLAVPLTTREARLLRHDVPASPLAYEYYLRANPLAYEVATWERARELYERSVEEDPNFAPAWARLGRLYRVLSKYGLVADGPLWLLKAEAAFKRALELNPDLPLAHSSYAAFELDAGRTEAALTRLLARAPQRRGDAELMATLVQACRYCGLLEASAAAHVQARRIDPRVPTSVLHTWWAMGEHGRVLDETERGTDPIKGLVLAALGRRQDAIAALRQEERRFANAGMSAFASAMRLLLEGDRDGSLRVCHDIQDQVARDPEATYYVGRTRLAAGDAPGGLELIARAVEGGYFCTGLLRADPWLAPVRGHATFLRTLERAEERARHAAQVFRDAGGEALLGVRVD